MIFLGGFALLALGILLGVLYAEHLSPIYLYSQLSRLPIFGRHVRLYLTAYYAREWGNLIGQGIELMEIVELMQRQKIMSLSGNWKRYAGSFVVWSVFSSESAGLPFLFA